MQLNINADKLKKLRETRCWSQQQLSELSGLSLRTVQRIEAKSVASQESIKCLAAVFEVQVQELFDASMASEETSLYPPQLTEEQPQHTSQSAANSENTLHKATGHQQVKRLYFAFALVFASHMFGFYGIFSAFEEQRIGVETFQLLKNTLSVVLVFSAIIFAVKHALLKKKYGLGSSFL